MRSQGREPGLWETSLVREDKGMGEVAVLTSNEAALQGISCPELLIALAEDAVVTAIQSDICISQNGEKK